MNDSSGKNLRKYGSSPFQVAVVHGGPGAGGEMAPVAERLSIFCGVLEPFQTATSVDGQVEELKSILEEDGQGPMTLIGFSWGAWLSVILAARYSDLISNQLRTSLYILLIDRGQPELANEKMMCWAKYLREEAKINGYRIIDTTFLTEEQTHHCFMQIILDPIKGQGD